ncbi:MULTISPECIES: ATP-binding protein [Spirulina sp. CCY15215]|uniref:sensor histidine kinase n=1 Tax=Spirulina sp. CCY15215 TaxID=2767591 RepID=UPI0032AFF391
MNSPSNSSNRLQRHLSRYSTAGVFCVSLVVALVSVIPLYNKLKIAQEQDLQAKLSNRTLAAEQVQQSSIEVAEQVTSRTFARKILSDYVQGKASLTELQELSLFDLEDAIDQNDSLVGVSRFDRTDQLLVHVGVDSTLDLSDILQGETGEMLLAQEQGDTLALFFPLRNGSQVLPEHLASLLHGAIAHDPTEIEHYDNQIIAFGTLPHTDWIIAVQMDRQELYGAVNRDLFFVGLAVFGVSTIATVGLVFVLRPLIKRVTDADELEKEVLAKTTAFEELKQTQIQLFQAEKMSSLGQLVAGIAHEINNPVGFLKGNIQPAQNYIKDLLGLIDLYQEKMPNPDADIEDEIKEIDLEFIREDLPNIINSMNSGVDRIRNISDGLRIFSRQDRDYKTAFNIHEGIESTILILKHRTKSNEQRPAVEVVKNYGDLPEVQCFPGQLNQVFMNILANAFDAFEEANQGKTFEEIKADPNIITITTSVVDKQVQIQIQDNACGMKRETIERIFEQGFTTKEVGKGTGLGMAIAHQIITEKHGGSIECSSEFGKGTIFTIALSIV